MAASLAWWEIGGIVLLSVWLAACICYAFRVPWCHVVLNRHNRCGVLASWAVATTRSLKDNPGAHTLEFCDVESAGWQTALSSVNWTWHAFLWFPGKIAAFRLQGIGREIALFSELTPPARGLIDEHAGRMSCFVRELYPLSPSSVRQLRLVQRLNVGGQEVERIVWQWSDENHGASH